MDCVQFHLWANFSTTKEEAYFTTSKGRGKTVERFFYQLEVSFNYYVVIKYLIF